MLVPRTLVEALQPVISHGPAEDRLAALAVLGELPSAIAVSGLMLLQHVRDAGLELAFIMLSASPDPESIIAAYRLRVFDFVVKSDDMKQLIGAVQGAVAGPVQTLP